MKHLLLAVFCVLFSSHLIFCDSSEEKEVKTKCDKLGEKAEIIEDSINATYRFLRTPEEYKGLVDACQAVNFCAASMKSHKETFLEKYELCSFYRFYNKDFSSCAKKLIAKKDDKIPCLDTLFNDIYEPDVNECDQWDSLQPCIKSNIESVCGEKTDEWVKQAAVFRKAMCEKKDDDD